MWSGRIYSYSDLYVDGIGYEIIDESTCRVYSANSYPADGEIIIPTVVEGEYWSDYGSGWGRFKVTEISPWAFVNSSYDKNEWSSWTPEHPLKKVFLPESIEVIGENAFYNCYNLEEIAVYEKYEEWNSWTGDNETKMNRAAPRNLRIIGNSAFMNCNSLVTVPFFAHHPEEIFADSYDYEAGYRKSDWQLEYIGNSAFENCYSLNPALNETGVFLNHPKLAYLGERAFYNCTSLSQISFTSNYWYDKSLITEILPYTFYNCKNAYTYLYNIETIHAYSLACDQVASGMLIFGEIKHIGEGACQYRQLYGLPNTLETIGDYAFKNSYTPYSHSGLYDIKLGNSIQSLGIGVFQNASLGYAKLEVDIREIPESTFEDARLDYEHLVLTDNVEIIGSYALKGSVWDDSYGDISLPTSIKEIQAQGLAYRKITKADLPNIEYLGSGAFQYCSSLKHVSLPSQLSEIRSSLFSGCSSLSEIEIPEDVQSIGGNAFQGCSSLKSIKLPSKVTTLGAEAFKGCSSLEYVEMPQDIQTINNYTFESCTSLKSIKLPSKVTKIGDGAFRYCSVLESIVIPESVEQIGSYAFYGCSNLSSIKSLSSTPPICIANTFESAIYSKAALTIPDAGLAAYKSATGWRNFNNVICIISAIHDEDWRNLKILKSELETMGWEGNWNTDDEPSEDMYFEGIRTLNSRVTEIDLSSYGLKGRLPTTVFLFPEITKIDLSNNQLEGNISEIGGSLLEKNSELCNKLTELNLSNNLLSGNLSDVANRCSELKRLNVSHNRISDLYPALTGSFTYLNYKDQDIDLTLDLQFGIDSETFLDKIPTIIRYYHGLRNYPVPSDIMAWFPDVIDTEGVAYDHYKVPLYFKDPGLRINEEALEDVIGYKGDNEVIMTLSGKEETKCRARLIFSPGDVNFDGYLNISDLQCIIGSACNYFPVQFSNFTAADVTANGYINVSDVVAMVNILMNDEHPQPEGTHLRTPDADEDIMATSEMADADVSCGQDGIILTTSRPIAAFDLIIDNVTDIDLSGLRDSGFVCHTRPCSGGLHIIGYSLSGATLPVGKNVIPAKFSSSGVNISYSALCDENTAMLATSIDRGVISGVQASVDNTPEIFFENGVLTISVIPGEKVIWTAVAADGIVIAEQTSKAEADGTSQFYVNFKGVVIISAKTETGIYTKKINFKK